MSKIVLLARPHPFIVSEMRPFLEQNGYSPTRLDVLTDLPELAPQAAGAVVSLAVSATVDEAPESIVRDLRSSSSRLAILFASLIDLSKIESKLVRLLQTIGIAGSIIGVDSPVEAHAKLGKVDTFVYLGKNDLVSVERRAIAARIVQRHFR